MPSLEIVAPQTTEAGGSNVLALRPKARRIPEARVCRIFARDLSEFLVLLPAEAQSYGLHSQNGTRVL